jgi:hypothetical protein
LARNGAGAASVIPEILTGCNKLKDFLKFEEKLAKATKKTYVIVTSEAERKKYEKLANATVVTTQFMTF